MINGPERGRKVPLPKAEKKHQMLKDRSMTRWFGSGLGVIPNLFRDLGSRFREFGFKAPPCGRGALLGSCRKIEIRFEEIGGR